MRIGVVSDTHGSLQAANQAIIKMGQIDALIHAGDLYSDALHIGSIIKVPIYAVPGNCDIPGQGPEELVITLNGVKIFITHGHLYRVKSTLQMLCYRAQELGAQLVVFGHTHVPINSWENNLLLFNPGSTSRPPNGIKSGCGILNISENGVKGQLISMS